MLHFYISLEAEKNKLMDMFCVGEVAATHAYRAKQYHFPWTLAQKMYHEPRFQWDEQLEDFLIQSYQENEVRLHTSKAFFESYWQMNEHKYFPKLNQFFQEEIPEYCVLLAHFLDAISNWTEPNIVINAYSYQTKNPLYHIYSLLYEITLSQVFIRTRKLKTKEEFSDDKLWMSAELTAFAFLTTTFPEFSEWHGTGYPRLDTYADQFVKLMQENKSFNLILPEILRFKFDTGDKIWYSARYTND